MCKSKIKLDLDIYAQANKCGQELNRLNTDGFDDDTVFVVRNSNVLCF